MLSFRILQGWEGNWICSFTYFERMELTTESVFQMYFIQFYLDFHVHTHPYRKQESKRQVKSNLFFVFFGSCIIYWEVFFFCFLFLNEGRIIISSNFTEVEE